MKTNDTNINETYNRLIGEGEELNDDNTDTEFTMDATVTAQAFEYTC